jgi:hypothetical protein
MDIPDPRETLAQRLRDFFASRENVREVRMFGLQAWSTTAWWSVPVGTGTCSSAPTRPTTRI